MSSKLSSAAVVLPCALALSAGGFALAQQAQPGRARLERPQPANLQVAPAPAALQQLLQNWSDSSAKIEKLQGKHKRHVFDHVFQTEKRAEGVFYYEAPDKGRIDLKPAEIGPRDVSIQQAKGVPYKLQPDKEERWICNGTEIMQIKDAEKAVDIIPIPANGQGANIMDGPLPFLFGMPPDKALRRYEMKIVQENAQKALLTVKPRWQQDAANWREAQVVLSKDNYLPEAVKLIDPAGNLETWYQFEQLEPNKRELLPFVKDIIGNDPFKPRLIGYRKNILQAAAAVEEQPPQPQQPVLPAVVNFPLKEAKALLQRIGCRVEIKAGQAAPQGPLAMVVYEQNPPGRTPYERGMTVTLTVHTPGGQMPDLSGYFWKDVKAVFDGASPAYQLTWKQGPAANDAAEQYTVLAQRPQAGEPLQPGGGVALLVSTAPQPAAAGGEAAERR